LLFTVKFYPMLSTLIEKIPYRLGKMITGILLVGIGLDMFVSFSAIFRQSFRNLFQNKWLFIIISGLVFGGMHVFTGNNISKLDLLYLIPYSAPGMAFAYMLYKTDNIFVSMGFHMLHNGIMIALQFLTIYFL